MKKNANNIKLNNAFTIGLIDFFLFVIMIA
jgi:hypothetical protein